MESPATNERRLNKRYEGIIAEYAFLASEYEDYKFAEIKDCFVSNFSSEGSCIYVDEAVTDPLYVFLRLYDPNSTNPIPIIGGVVWSAYAGGDKGPNARNRLNVGIKFLHIDEANRRRIDLMINFFEAQQPKRKGNIDYV